MGKHVAFKQPNEAELRSDFAELRKMAVWHQGDSDAMTPAQSIASSVASARKIISDGDESVASRDMNTASSEEDEHYANVLNSVTRAMTDISDEINFIDNDLSDMLSLNDFYDLNRMLIYANKILVSVRRIYVNINSLKLIGLAYAKPEDSGRIIDFLPTLFDDTIMLSAVTARFEQTLSEYLSFITTPEPDLVRDGDSNKEK